MLFRFFAGIHPRDDPDVVKHQLKPLAVPTVFPGYPTQKQITNPRKIPKRRMVQDADHPPTKKHKQNQADCDFVDTDSLTYKLEMTRKLLTKLHRELKMMKVKRRDHPIAYLINELHEQKVLNNEQFELVNSSFSENTLFLIEKELKSLKKNKTDGTRYPEDVKQFEATMNFYSPQVYNLLRKYLHLPRPRTVRKQAASVSCEPGFLREVIYHLKMSVSRDQSMKDCILMFDSMAIRKEIVYEQKTSCYVGFVDCGRLQVSTSDVLATEALVFMVVGLNGRWKYPVAYFLVDHLSGAVRAEMVNQTLCMLTDSGLTVHGIVCDCSYANQRTASQLGCLLFSGLTKPCFAHPAQTSNSAYICLMPVTC